MLIGEILTKPTLILLSRRVKLKLNSTLKIGNMAILNLMWYSEKKVPKISWTTIQTWVEPHSEQMPPGLPRLEPLRLITLMTELTPIKRDNNNWVLKYLTKRITVIMLLRLKRLLMWITCMNRSKETITTFLMSFLSQVRLVPQLLGNPQTAHLLLVRELSHKLILFKQRELGCKLISKSN